MNHPSESSIEKKQLQQAAAIDDFVSEIQDILLRSGVKASANQVTTLTAEFGRAAVRNQADWLSRRSAQTLRLFCAAVRKNYEEPPAEANSLPAPPVLTGVTRVGKGSLRKGELLSEIRLHGRAVVLSEMADYHDRCRRDGKPDALLSAQCRMIDFLTTATDEEIIAELTEVT